MLTRTSRPLIPALVAGLLLALAPMSAQQPAGIQLPPDARRTFAAPAAYVPDLPKLAAATSELRDVVQRFSTDRQGLLRFYTVPGSVERRTRLRDFQDAWLKALPGIDFAKLSQEGKADYVLLRNHLEYQQALLGREERNEREIAPLVPFAQTITRLAEDRQKLEFITADQALAAVQALGAEVQQAQASLEASLAGSTRPAGMTPAVGVRASQRVDALRGALQQWFAFYNGYDPAFTENVPAAYQPVAKALTAYSTLVRQKIGGLAGAAPAAAAGPGTGGGRGGGRGGQAPERGGRRRDCGGPDWARRPPGGPRRGDDPVHAGAADRDRQPRVRVVRSRDEEGVARAGVRRRLDEGARGGEEQVRAGRRPAGHDPRTSRSRPRRT